MPRGHLGQLVVLKHALAGHLAAKLVFSSCSGVLGCLAAAVASMSCSTFRVVTSGAAEMPSLLQGLEDVHKKLGIGNMEGMKKSIIGGFSGRGLYLAGWLGSAPAQWRLDLLSLLSGAAVALMPQVCLHLPWLFLLA